MGVDGTPRLSGWHAWSDAHGATLQRRGRLWRRPYRWRAADGRIRRIDHHGEVSFEGDEIVVREELLTEYDIWHISLVAVAPDGGTRQTVLGAGDADEQAAAGRWLAHHGGVRFRDTRTGPPGVR